MKKLSLLVTCVLLACTLTACSGTGDREPVIQQVEQQPLSPDDMAPSTTPGVSEPSTGTDVQEPEATEEPGKVADTAIIKDRNCGRQDAKLSDR